MLLHVMLILSPLTKYYASLILFIVFGAAVGTE